MKLNNNRKGFTLIELLVVIAIIGILSTLAVVSLGGARAKARDAKRISDIKQVQTALELYYGDKNNYPYSGTGTYTVNLGQGTGLKACLDANGFIDYGSTCGNSGASIYMAKVPSDPVSSNTYTYKATDNTSYGIKFTTDNVQEGLGFSTQYVCATPTGMASIAQTATCP